MKFLSRICIRGLNEYSGGCQTHNFDYILTLNRHGNLHVPHAFWAESLRLNKSINVFIWKGDLVFDRSGKCISHLPKKGQMEYAIVLNMLRIHSFKHGVGYGISVEDHLASQAH